jgi:hypothetical protein
MERTIAWSYDLLSAGEQRVLSELSVFRSPFRADAAARVVEIEGLANHLQHLVQCSMLARVSTPHGTRFRILEPIRQYVAQQIESGAEAGPGERHAEYFAERVGFHIRWQQRTEAHGWLESGLDCLDHPPDLRRDALVVVAPIRSGTKRRMSPASWTVCPTLVVAVRPVVAAAGPTDLGRASGQTQTAERIAAMIAADSEANGTPFFLQTAGSSARRARPGGDCRTVESRRRVGQADPPMPRSRSTIRWPFDLR